MKRTAEQSEYKQMPMLKYGDILDMKRSQFYRFVF